MSQPDPDKWGYARSIGYSADELRGVPEGVACRGCSNPTATADLRPGETVLDLGSGAGLDAFLAAEKVGPRGRVVGIDASAEIVAKATEYAAKGNYRNVVFKVGKMDHLPLEDTSVDVVVSNCVINHAADKRRVFEELFRCLKPEGRMVVTDLVVEGEFSEAAKKDKVWGEWLTHASGKQDYLAAIECAGFRGIVVVLDTAFPMAEGNERLRGKIVNLAVKAWK